MPGPQTPRPQRPPVQHDAKKNPLGYIIQKWKDFTRQAEAGALDPNAAKSIRTILTTHTRNAILQGLLASKTNIFHNMHPILDPRVEHDGPPLLSAEQYARENALAIEDLKTFTKTRLANQAGSNTGTGTATGSGAGTPSQQGSSPIGTPQPQPQIPNQNQTGGPSPNPTAAASARPISAPTNNATAPNMTGRPPIRPTPIPEGMMGIAEVRKILGMPEVQRQAAYAQSPGLKEKFHTALTHYQALSAKNNEARAAAAGGGNARPPNSAPSSGPSTPSSSQNQSTSNIPNQTQNQNQARPPSLNTPARPPQQNPHGGTPTPNPNPTQGGVPPRPFNLNLPPQRQGPPTPPQPPPENEKARRKRKFREYVKEEAPGLEVEVGVDQIVSDYLDAFIDESARGAIRLAKHRKGSRVELKDMALFLEVTHGIKLPGFNAQLPQRQHVSTDTERKRGKAVAPRAARKGKEAE